MHRGVYAVGHTSLTRNGRFMAAVLACGDGAALSHFSAAVLWGMLKDRGQLIHVTAPSGERCRGIVVHRRRSKASGFGAFGIVVTTPARTLVDLADVVQRRRTLERAIDEAEYLRLDWKSAAPRHGRRGSGLLSSVLAVHEPGSTRTLLRARGAVPRVLRRHGLSAARGERRHRGLRVRFRVARAAPHRGDRRRRAHGTRAGAGRDPVKDADLQIAGWRVVRVTSVRLVRGSRMRSRSSCARLLRAGACSARRTASTVTIPRSTPSPSTAMIAPRRARPSWVSRLSSGSSSRTRRPLVPSSRAMTVPTVPHVALRGRARSRRPPARRLPTSRPLVSTTGNHGQP